MPDNTNFACIICHEIVRDCRSTSCCSALLCGQCVEGHEMSICPSPSCRRPDVQFARRPDLQRLANDLDVECSLCRQSYKHADVHGNWCPSQKIRCHFAFLGCSWTDKRKFHEAHLQESHGPRCPSCHEALELGRPKQTDAFCDGCQQSIMKNLNAMICSNCDYLECPGCFISRPIKNFAPGCSIGRRVDSIDVMDAEQEVDEGMNGVKA